MGQPVDLPCNGIVRLGVPATARARLRRLGVAVLGDLDLDRPLARIALHRLAMQLGIPCLTSIDTANALAEMIESRFGPCNTELVDINHLRAAHRRINFAKMQGCGDDYIFIENFDGALTAPEALCVSLCDRHRGIGGDGIVLIERSEVADARMDTFSGTVDSLKGSIETFMITAGTPFIENVLQPIASGLTDAVNKVTEWADENPELVSSLMGVVLAGAIAAGNRARIHDAVVLKTLGARRTLLIRAYLYEYFLQ